MAVPKYGFTSALEGQNGGIGAVCEAGGAGGELNCDLFGDFEVEAPGMVQSKAVKTAGRPKGARNKRTEEWVSYLLQRYKSPLVGLLELCARSPAELAAEVGLIGDIDIGDGVVVKQLLVGEAVKIQVAAMTAALPYIHQRLPQSVQVEASTSGTLVLNLGMFAPVAQRPVLLMGDEQNQQLTVSDESQSDPEKSDDTSNPLQPMDIISHAR